jgi:hypothetical protein
MNGTVAQGKIYNSDNWHLWKSKLPYGWWCRQVPSGTWLPSGSRNQNFPSMGIKKLTSSFWSAKRTLQTQRPLLVGGVSALLLRLERCRVVSATGHHGHWSRFSRPEPLLFIKVVNQLSSRCWVDPVPDIQLLTKSCSAGNRTRNLWICSQELWPLDHRGCLSMEITFRNLQFLSYGATSLTRRRVCNWDVTPCDSVRTDVSEERSASIIRVKGIGELWKTLAVTSNRRTLRRNTN